MSDTKRFYLADVLTISTGRMVGSMEGVYELLNWMTDDNLYTHQLPRAWRECQPFLLEQFPPLASVDDRTLDEALKTGTADEACAGWVKFAATAYGLSDHYDVPRLPKGSHEVKYPLEELIEMRGSKEGIIVVTH